MQFFDAVVRLGERDEWRPVLYRFMCKYGGIVYRSMSVFHLSGWMMRIRCGKYEKRVMMSFKWWRL
jgi:hypothetical protein